MYCYNACLILLYSETGYNDLYEYFLRGKESLRIDQKVQKVTGLNREQVSSIIIIYVQWCDITVVQVMAMEHLAKNNSYFSQLENYVAGNTVCNQLI